MKEKIFKTKQTKELFRHFALMIQTAYEVYRAVQGGEAMNFYMCYKEYDTPTEENKQGRYGWIKEHRCFERAVDIHAMFTASESWDLLEEIEDEFGEDLLELTYEEIVDYFNEIENQ